MGESRPLPCSLAPSLLTCSGEVWHQAPKNVTGSQAAALAVLEGLGAARDPPPERAGEPHFPEAETKEQEVKPKAERGGGGVGGGKGRSLTGGRGRVAGQPGNLSAADTRCSQGTGAGVPPVGGCDRKAAGTEGLVCALLSEPVSSPL